MREIDLCGEWHFRGCDPGQGERMGAHLAESPLGDWKPARVPGVVHLDLLRLGEIPDPFYGRNEPEVRWVEEKEWWYRRAFVVPPEMLDADSVVLRFEGLDTFAAIWLNDHQVGRADSMFIPWGFEVRSLLRAGENALVVRFDSPIATLDQMEREQGKLGSVFYSARPYGRKAQYSFGWDWGPRLPTSGIWRPVSLRAYKGGRVLHVFAPTNVGEGAASVRVQVEVETIAPGEFVIEAALAREGEEVSDAKALGLDEGKHVVEIPLSIAAPALWWPNGYGEQNLYDLRVAVTQGGEECDCHNERIGLRKVELVQEPDDEGKTFIFRVNGVPVFCKGANWIPADSFIPRADEGVYRRLIGECVGAHFNMLRIWGGGIYENEAFYRLCDEKGILIWQDFMFACAEYPETEDFWRSVRQEAETVVKMLRNHACIAIWCGNNENDWGFRTGWFGKKEKYYGETIYHRILPEVCGRLDPTRPYWPSSPFGGDTANDMAEGDRHAWDVWGGKPIRTYLEDTGRFISEFGFCAPPVIESVLQFCPPAEMAVDSPMIIQHVKFGENMGNLLNYVRDELGVSGEDFEAFLDAAQMTQAVALRTAVEHWRRRKFHTAGALIWQIDDCWPVISWSLVDYYGRRKPSYYYVRRAMAPVLLSLAADEDAVQVWVVNDTLERVQAEAQVGAALLSGEVLGQRGQSVVVPANESRLVMTVPLSELGVRQKSAAVAFAALRRADAILGQQVLPLVRFQELALPRPRITPEVWRGGGGALSLVLNPDAPAFGVRLTHSDAGVVFEDNYVDLCPGLPNQMRVQAPAEMPRAALLGGLSMAPLLPVTWG